MPSQTRVALVTGGAKRVGRAISLRLASLGYDIALTYLSSASEAAEVTRAIEQTHGRAALAIRADLTRPAEAVEAVDQAFSARFDRLDVLVNNASMWAPGRLAQTTPELTRRLWAIHAESPLLLCQRMADRLGAAGGQIVNMVDLLAEKPWPQFLAYCASKAALWNLTLGLARELAPKVTVNGIAPGVAEWPDDYPEDERRKYLQRVPLARAGTPEDVAGLVAYFIGDGRYVTGQIIRLDGGRSIT